MREWELRLLYKRIKAKHPEVRMATVNSGLLQIRYGTTNRYMNITSLADWNNYREQDRFLGLSCGCDYYVDAPTIEGSVQRRARIIYNS